MYHVIKIKEFVWLSLIPSLFLTHYRYSVLYTSSLVLTSHLCCILYSGHLIDWFAVLHFMTELFVACDANSTCPDVFYMSTIIVLRAEDKSIHWLRFFPWYFLVLSFLPHQANTTLDSLIYLLFHMTQLINRNNTKSHRGMSKSIISEHWNKWKHMAKWLVNLFCL